ncbi:MAG: hypothetical protein O2907_00085 [Proteobacteria bacterium]|nr:hypothetical protein [Pseudomonadota bacterium]
MAGVLVLILAACGAEKEPAGVAADVRPIAQTLTLEIDPEKTDYSGTTTISLQVAKEQASIRLHAKDMQITSLSLSGKDGAIAVTHESGARPADHRSGETVCAG